jgi:streptomycin 6-kinase
LRWDSRAQLVERLTGAETLPAMAERGEDSVATRILCRVIAALHRPRPEARPACLIPIRRRFRSLERMASHPGPHRLLLAEAWSQAERLIAASTDQTVLHGDIHHANVLQDAKGEWRAIDPKGVVGPRAYDYANILFNPNSIIAERPGRFRKQAQVIARESGLDLEEMIAWAFAHAALSACWSIEPGLWKSSADARSALAVAEIARAELVGS